MIILQFGCFIICVVNEYRDYIDVGYFKSAFLPN